MEQHARYRRTGWKKVTAQLAAAVSTVLIATTTPNAIATPASGEGAGSSDSTLSWLISMATEKEGQASGLELDLGTLREDVNKALVDLHTAQVAAEKARLAAKAARKDLITTDGDVVAAQGEFSKIAQAAFNQGATAGQPMYSGADDSADALDRATFLRGDAAKKAKIIEQLDRKRTEQANKESNLRVARTEAETAEGTAKTAQSDAETKLANTEAELAKVVAERDKAIQERDLAQAKLKAAREALSKMKTEPGTSPADQQAHQNKVAQQAADSVTKVEDKPAAPAAQAPAEQTTPAAPSQNSGQNQGGAPAAQAVAAEAPAAQAPAAENNGSSEAAVGALQLALELANQVAQSQLDHTQVDSPFPSASDIQSDTPTGLTVPTTESTSTPGSESSTAANSSANGTSQSDASSESGSNSGSASDSAPQSTDASGLSREQKIETVISRAMAQTGQPYAWGGGNATGPTKGIRDGGVADSFGDYNKVGFDCSGLTLYSYAGVGIDLPHYTGYQYQRGTQVPASQMQRGDLIFYGPNGHGHVAIYLGDGTMIEAPQSGDVVKVSPVRWGGMTPNVVRLV